MPEATGDPPATTPERRAAALCLTKDGLTQDGIPKDGLPKVAEKQERDRGDRCSNCTWQATWKLAPAHAQALNALTI